LRHENLQPIVLSQKTDVQQEENEVTEMTPSGYFVALLQDMQRTNLVNYAKWDRQRDFAIGCYERAFETDSYLSYFGLMRNI